jgi:hypothetical protein
VAILESKYFLSIHRFSNTLNKTSQVDEAFVSIIFKVQKPGFVI